MALMQIASTINLSNILKLQWKCKSNQTHLKRCNKNHGVNWFFWDRCCNVISHFDILFTFTIEKYCSQSSSQPASYRPVIVSQLSIWYTMYKLSNTSTCWVYCCGAHFYGVVVSCGQTIAWAYWRNRDESKRRQRFACHMCVLFFHCVIQLYLVKHACI